MKRKIAVLMSALLLLPVLVWAQQKGGIELISIAEVEIAQKNDQGAEVLTRVAVDKANVAPGDTVIYTTTYLNKAGKPATNVAINNPLPEHMLYVDKSAEGTGTRIEFSVDKGKTYGPIKKLSVKTASGKEKPATADDISNIKWTLEQPLPPGGKGSVSFRAKVK